MELWDDLAKERPREPFYRHWLGRTCAILVAVGDADEGERLARRPAPERHQPDPRLLRPVRVRVG